MMIRDMQMALVFSCYKGTGKLRLARGTLENILFETMLQAIECLMVLRAK